MGQALPQALGRPAVTAAVSALLPSPRTQPSFAHQLLTSGNYPSASGLLGWQLHAQPVSRAVWGQVPAGGDFDSHRGVATKYPVVEATREQAFRILPKVPIGNRTQALIDTSHLGCLPFHLISPDPEVGFPGLPSQVNHLPLSPWLRGCPGKGDLDLSLWSVQLCVCFSDDNAGSRSSGLAKEAEPRT